MICNISPYGREYIFAHSLPCRQAGRSFRPPRLLPLYHNIYLKDYRQKKPLKYHPLPSFICICLLSFIISCSPQDRLTGYVYYRLNSNPTTLDPALIVDVPGGSISAKLFNGLVRLNKDMNIASDIASEWKVSRDGLVYRFKLRRGVKFSNNREVKAGDFKYSFERVLSPRNRSPNTWVFDKIKGAREFMDGKSGEVSGIKIIGDYLLEITLEKPFSPFLNLLTMTAAYVVAEEDVRKWGVDFSSHPIGTGPFVLLHWLPNRELQLDARKDYFDDPPKIKGIVYKIIPEDLTTITEFELGNLDVIGIPASAFSRFGKDKKWSNLISSITGINTYYLGLNCSKRPFDNPILRKAINHAIDRGKILTTVYEGRGRLASGPVPDILRKWKAPTTYEYNPSRAKELIKTAGDKADTFEVNFYITPDPEMIDIAEVIQSYLKEVGIRANIKQLEWSAYKEAINRGETDMFWLGWWADYSDPENFLFPLFHSSNFGPAGNRARYKNHEVDSLIEKGQHAHNAKERDIFYEKAENMIVADAPWVFFWHKTDFTVRQSRIKNYKLYPIYSMDKGTEISF
ncbi:MAG: ABC transporter substrate-binding protein [Nitrospirae bacterium]|nr:ABC transporter substrate-binding protein [Nitrospirota bacterium]